MSARLRGIAFGICVSSFVFAPSARADPADVEPGAPWHPSRTFVVGAERLFGFGGDDATIGRAPGDPHGQSGLRWIADFDAPASRMLARAPRIAFDFNVGDGYTIGGAPIVDYSSRGPAFEGVMYPTRALAFGTAARVGKIVPLQSSVALWARASVLVGYVSQWDRRSIGNRGTGGTDDSLLRTTLIGSGIVLEPVLLVATGRGTAVTLVPHVDTILVGRSTRSWSSNGGPATNEGGPYRMIAYGLDFGFSVSL